MAGKPWATEADGTNYVAASPGDAPNYKLIIVDSRLQINSLTIGSETVGPSTHPTITADPGDSIPVTANGATGGTRLTYKIVSRASGGTVGYGQDTGNTGLTVEARDLHDTALAEGRYTVYVWAQQDNGDHSHEGSKPQHFTLEVIDTTPPRVESVFPMGDTVSLETSGLSVTFDEDIDTTTTGAVAIDKGATLTNAAWQDDRTIVYDLSGLDYATEYTVDISGFQDLSGNVMSPHTHTFTTMDEPPPGQHSVTVSPDPAGGGSPGATPNSGWKFTRWSSDSPGVGFVIDTAQTTTFAMPDSDVSITAHYQKIDDGGDLGPVDPGNPHPGPEPGGNGSSGSRSSSRSSGGSSTPDRQVAKTQLPASAFSWDGDRTLTINYERITPLGLLSVQWDDVETTAYSVYEGSVIIRFDQGFMATQAPGDHTIKVKFMNHTGEAAVTVGGLTTEVWDDNETHNPSTGGYPDGSYPGATDNPNTGDGRSIWAALLLGSLGGIALVVRRLKPVA